MESQLIFSENIFEKTIDNPEIAVILTAREISNHAEPLINQQTRKTTMNDKMISSAKIAMAICKDDPYRINRDALRGAARAFSSLIARVKGHFEQNETPRKWDDRFASFIGDCTTLSMYRTTEGGKQTPTAEGQVFRRAFLVAFPPEKSKTEPTNTITLALRALRRAAKSGERPSLDEAKEFLALAQDLSELVQE